MGPSTGSIIGRIESSEGIDRQDIGRVGIVRGIAAPMANRAGGSHPVNTEEHLVDIASIGVKSSVVVLVVDWIRSEKGVDIASIGAKCSVVVLVVDCVRSENGVDIMEARVDIPSIGCMSSGVSLTVACACSTNVVGGVEPAIGNTFTGIIPKTIVANGSGETT